MSPAPKPSLAHISRYTPGKRTAPGVARPIKLSANENALGASAEAHAAFAEAAGDLARYPDPRAAALRAAIAAKHDFAPDQIIFGAGSDEVFSLAAQAFLSPGDNMVQPAHGFAAWAIAAYAAGAGVRNAPERDYRVDVDALLAAVDAHTRVVFVANPANPTGTKLPPEEIARLHAGLRDDILLVLDGAYAEFLGADAEGDFALARAVENVLVTRTFSKVYGLAALRIGWGYGAPGLIGALDSIRLPFNTTSAAQAAALAALGDEAFLRRSLSHVEAGRARLARALDANGFGVIAPAANFVTASCAPLGLSGAAAEAALARRGVIVRALGGYGLADHIRITIGTDEELDSAIAALAGLREDARQAAPNATGGT